MSSTLYPVAGCHFFIGAASMSDKAADFVAGDFSGVTWTEVDGWTQMGDFGDDAALITTQVINRSRDVKMKGTANAGSQQNVFALDLADAGQVAMMAAGAAANRNSYPFKLVLNDPGAGNTPTTVYYIGLVMSARQTGGGANNIRNLNATTEINSNIVIVAAS